MVVQHHWKEPSTRYECWLVAALAWRNIFGGTCKQTYKHCLKRPLIDFSLGQGSKFNRGFGDKGSETINMGVCVMNRCACRLKNRLASEEQKFQRWHDDNLRRRNNYIPFVFNILRILAEEGKLGGLIAKAKEPKPAPSTDS